MEQALTLSPERRIRSVGHMVVKDDEVTYIVDFKFHLWVEFCDGGFGYFLVGKHCRPA